MLTVKRIEAAPFLDENEGNLFGDASLFHTLGCSTTEFALDANA